VVIARLLRPAAHPIKGRASAQRTQVPDLVEPTLVSAAFGRRRLAFFRSPGGFVFEVQVLERKI
jgi:hypothetical protein